MLYARKRSSYATCKVMWKILLKKIIFCKYIYFIRFNISTEIECANVALQYCFPSSCFREYIRVIRYMQRGKLNLQGMKTHIQLVSC